VNYNYFVLLITKLRTNFNIYVSKQFLCVHNMLQTPVISTIVSVFGPTRVLSQRVNQCCVSLIWMVMQGEYTGIYPGSGKRRPYVQREGGVLYFLAPKCLRRGYKL
jgi:hypothetical protein